MQEFSIKQADTLWTGQVAALGMTLGLVCSFTIWTNIGRTFPQCPLILAGCPDWVSSVFYALALLSSVALIFKKKIVPSGLLLSLSISFLVLLDLNCFQPWVYEYLLIILINCFNHGPDKNENNSKAIALLLLAIYFFSGLEKLNWRFITAIGPWFIGLSDSTQVSFGDNAIVMAAAATLAIYEVGLAVALANPKTRFLGLLGGIFMHLSIISMLGPRGHNAVVWPWNLIQIALLFHFLHLPWDLKQMLTLKKSNWLLCLAMTTTCLLIPALGLAQKADAYPAFALYSGDTPMGILEELFSKVVF